MVTIQDRDTIAARDLILPAMLCAAMFFVALVLAIILGLRGTTIIKVYYQGALFPAAVVLMLWCVIPFWRAPEYRAYAPSKAARMMLAKRWPLLIFPLFLTPVFNTGYTVAKTSFPYFTGYRWDHEWTNLDRLLFGVDPWRLTHAVFGPVTSEYLVWAYMLMWGIALVAVLPSMLFWARPSTAIRAQVSFMLIWSLGGVLGATIFSSAGPTFAGLADPALADHFAPLKAAIVQVLPEGNIVLRTQAYLFDSFGTSTVTKGAGISAMPSMHLATAALYVVMARGTRWFVPAVVFWLVIWVGSVHLGYHYAVDGIAGAMIAWAAWRVTAPRRAATAPELSPQLALA